MMGLEQQGEKAPKHGRNRMQIPTPKQLFRIFGAAGAVKFLTACDELTEQPSKNVNLATDKVFQAFNPKTGDNIAMATSYDPNTQQLSISPLSSGKGTQIISGGTVASVIKDNGTEIYGQNVASKLIGDAESLKKVKIFKFPIERPSGQTSMVFGARFHVGPNEPLEVIFQIDKNNSQPQIIQVTDNNVNFDIYGANGENYSAIYSKTSQTPPGSNAISIDTITLQDILDAAPHERQTTETVGVASNLLPTSPIVQPQGHAAQ